jgi:threonine/homoserine/homoserine lactone efflux protein
VSLSGFLVFCGVYVLAVATPGPGVTAVLARSLAQGTRGAPAYIAGFLLGDLIWFVAAAAGLAALAQTAQAAFLVVRYAGAAYLLYLAYRFWTAPSRPAEIDNPAPPGSPWSSFLSSLSLTLGNPKTMVFYIALLPTVVQLRTLGLQDYVLIALAIVVILPAVLGAYVLLASHARRLFRQSSSIQWLNRGAGTAMAGAAVVVATQ